MEQQASQRTTRSSYKAAAMGRDGGKLVLGNPSDQDVARARAAADQAAGKKAAADAAGSSLQGTVEGLQARMATMPERLLRDFLAMVERELAPIREQIGQLRELQEQVSELQQTVQEQQEQLTSVRSALTLCQQKQRENQLVAKGSGVTVEAVKAAAAEVGAALTLVRALPAPPGGDGAAGRRVELHVAGAGDRAALFKGFKAALARQCGGDAAGYRLHERLTKAEADRRNQLYQSASFKAAMAAERARAAAASGDAARLRIRNYFDTVCVGDEWWTLEKARARDGAAAGGGRGSGAAGGGAR